MRWIDRLVRPGPDAPPVPSAAIRVPFGLSGRQRQDCSRDVPYPARLQAPTRPPATPRHRPQGRDRPGAPGRPPARPRAPRPARNWPARPGPRSPTPYGSPAGPADGARPRHGPARRPRPRTGRRRTGIDPGAGPRRLGPGPPGRPRRAARRAPHARAGGCAPGTATTPPCCAAGSRSSTPGRSSTRRPTDIEATAVAEVVEAVPQVLSLLQLSAGPGHRARPPRSARPARRGTPRGALRGAVRAAGAARTGRTGPHRTPRRPGGAPPRLGPGGAGRRRRPHARRRPRHPHPARQLGGLGQAGADLRRRAEPGREHRAVRRRHAARLRPAHPRAGPRRVPRLARRPPRRQRRRRTARRRPRRGRTAARTRLRGAARRRRPRRARGALRRRPSRRCARTHCSGSPSTTEPTPRTPRRCSPARSPPGSGSTPRRPSPTTARPRCWSATWTRPCRAPCPALLDEVRAVGHPRTVQVLVALAAAHPDPALAKAVRRAAFQVHTGGA